MHLVVCVEAVDSYAYEELLSVECAVCRQVILVLLPLYPVIYTRVERISAQALNRIKSLIRCAGGDGSKPAE